MSGYDGYRNYDARVPPVYPSNNYAEDRNPGVPKNNQGHPRGFHDNPACVQYIDEPRPPRQVGGASNSQLQIQPSNGIHNGRQPPPPPQRYMGLEGRSRKPWSGVPMDTSMTFSNPGYTDSDQSSSQGVHSISGQGAIMGNMPVFSVMPDEEKKKTDADLYAIQPVQSAGIYPELPEDNDLTGRDLVTNPPEVLKL